MAVASREEQSGHPAHFAGAAVARRTQRVIITRFSSAAGQLLFKLVNFGDQFLDHILQLFDFATAWYLSRRGIRRT